MRHCTRGVYLMRATANIMQDEQLRLARVGFSTAAQTPAAATRTYITGSAIPISKAGLRVGHVVRWTLNMTKTAAGNAASTFDVCVVTAGTTANTARVAFTKPAGTNVADEAWVTITAIVRNVDTTSHIVGEFV